MKSHVADWQTRVYCVRIVATDGRVVRFTAYPTDLAMSNSQLYKADSGYEFSGVTASSTFASTSVDLEGFMTGAVGLLSLAEISSGVWDNARVFAFATSWALPIEDEEPLCCCILGKADITNDNQYKIEMMGLIDALSQSVGRTYTAQCGATLFDRNINGNIIPANKSRCTGPRAASDGPDIADYIVTGTVTSVTDQYMFADSARPEVSAWFDYGELHFLTGDNAGLAPIRVKAFTAGGVIFLQDALFYLPQPGDEYEMIPGCDKNLDGDCVNKYSNGINFFAFPHVPAPSEYTQVGRGA